MASVFRKDDMHVDKPKRNVYSKTHAKSLTTKFGQIICPFCQPVMNGESFTLKYSHVFNMLPFVFPVQTRVRASFQLYYVRWRNLWNQWEDFQFKMKPNLVKPYIKFTRQSRRDLLRVGGILDNIGVPVVTYHNTAVKIYLDNPEFPKNDFSSVYNPYTNTYQKYPQVRQTLITSDALSSGDVSSIWDYNDIKIFTGTTPPDAEAQNMRYAPYRYPINAEGITNVKFFTYDEPQENFVSSVYLLVSAVKSSVGQFTTSVTNKDDTISSDSLAIIPEIYGPTVGSITRNGKTELSNTIETIAPEIKYFIIKINRVGSNTLPIIPSPDGYQLKQIFGRYYVNSDTPESNPIGISVRPSDYPDHGIHLSDVVLDDLPYANIVNDNEKTLRIDVGPLRAIESVYNALIRHPENNPFLVNGVPEYNKFLLSYEGGADTYNYPLRYANWQDDAFTTALHSPQQGDAPLVGLVNQSSLGSYITFANDDGTKSRVKFYAISNEQSPGSSRAVSITSALDSQNNVNEPGVPSIGYVGELDEGSLDGVKFGFTINDLRNVNSYQRWKENNLRRGYKYRDQITAHFGVKPRFDVLDMPEYLGGSSRDMNVNQVTQTVETDSGALGDYAGQGYINGSSNHAITHFCDEEGFIIGLLTIMPIANYSQTIPKFLLRQNALDYFSPEFSKIGMQPILNRELDPIGSYYDNTGDKVFGYQRPWYDYLDIPDTLHGKFRTEFRNFVISRTFNQTPTLAEDFLVYDPNQVNNIFYVDDDEDKILGQFLFDFKVRIPIPLYGIPALE